MLIKLNYTPNQITYLQDITAGDPFQIGEKNYMKLTPQPPGANNSVELKTGRLIRVYDTTPLTLPVTASIDLKY